MTTKQSTEYRCVKCNKLLGVDGDNGFEIKCLRCGTLNIRLEALDEQVIITDPEGKILYTNGALERMTGYSTADVIGKTPAVWGKQMPPEFYADFWRVIKEEKRALHTTLKNRRKDGTIYAAELRVSPILDASGTIIFYVGCERKID